MENPIKNVYISYGEENLKDILEEVLRNIFINELD